MDWDLTLVHLNLRCYLLPLLKKEIGLSGERVELTLLESGHIVNDNGQGKFDRFSIKIPYCKRRIDWTLLMNGENVHQAPDFIMQDDSFLLALDVDEISNKVPSWANWNPADSHCLLNVVMELLNVFKDYQVYLLEHNPTLQRYLFEYETLISLTQVNNDDVELLVNMGSRTTVTFIIRINIDFSELPTSLPQDEKNIALLMVEFRENAKAYSELLLRQQIEEILGGHIPVPSFPLETSLLDYVPNVAEILTNKIADTVANITGRRLLYSTLFQRLERSFLQGDGVSYTNISFLLELNRERFVLNVQLPLAFPEEKPKMFLTSAMTYRKTEKFDDYPYSSDWPFDQMADHMLGYLKKRITDSFVDEDDDDDDDKDDK